MCPYSSVCVCVHLGTFLCNCAHTSAYTCLPRHTSVYLCPYLCIPLYTSALGRGTQRYTEVCASAYLCLPLCTSVSSAFYHVSKSWFPGIIKNMVSRNKQRYPASQDHSQPPPCQGFKIILSWQPGL